MKEAVIRRKTGPEQKQDKVVKFMNDSGTVMEAKLTPRQDPGKIYP